MNQDLLIQKKLWELSKSTFRASFHLKKKEFDYLQRKGYKEIKQHAHLFVSKRLAPENPINDGNQTPMKGHPVFIAQHATATCCRNCLEKWHQIKKNQALTDSQINYIVSLIMAWITKEYKKKEFTEFGSLPNP